MSAASCAGNGNPVSRLFQDAGISSSKTILSNIEQGRRHATNSFRSSTSLALEREWADDNREWNNYFQQSVVHGGGNQFSKEFPSFFMSEENKEEEEEFRQEWSDEHFTQLYIEQNALKLHKNIRTRRHSYSQTNAFVQEFLQNSSNNTNNCHQTNHCDLFQAQLYLLDHLLSAILTYPITSTCRPSATAEWNWGRLFSPARWCNKGEEENDEDDKILQNEHLKQVAIGRLQLLLGHLIINAGDPNSNKQEEKSGWGWEWEFYDS
jgi:hypothetical protein